MKTTRICTSQGRVIEALDEAKKACKVRFVGFTAQEPAIHLKMLAHNYRSIRCKCRSNCFDGTIAVSSSRCCRSSSAVASRLLGMKSLGGDGQPILHGVVARRKHCVRNEPACGYHDQRIDSLAVLRQN